MTSTRPCRFCKSLEPDSDLDVNNGICKACIQEYGFERCEQCKRLWSELTDLEGQHLCADCHLIELKLRNKIQSLDLAAPLAAKWDHTGPGRIHHEVLGLVFEDRGEWTTMPLQIGALGYESHFIFWDGEPTEKQLTTAAHILRSTQAFRDEMALRLADCYTKEIRPAYLESDEVEPDSMPELHACNEVWNMISELKQIYIENEMDVAFAFQPAFDDDHDWMVRTLDGAFMDVMLDG